MLRTLRRFALLLPFTLAACGGDTTAPTIETATFAPSLGVDLAASTRLPSGMYTRDLAVGTGALVTSGQRLSMRYTGWLANGTQFDANAAPAAPFQFTLGAGGVITGWDQGVGGMRVGGRRQLVIPPSLGYGSQRVGPIPPNSILVFNVEIVAAQ